MRPHSATHRSARAGQAALEYMVVIGIALLITTPIILQAQQSSVQLKDSFDNGLIRNALDTIEESASLVQSQGPPARVTFTVRLPDGVVRTNATASYIVIEQRARNNRTAEFFAFLDFNVTGDLPTNEGRHTLVAEATDSYVNITAR